MSLVADYSSTSESEDTFDETTQTENAEKPKLPSANSLLGDSISAKSGEVFANPYKQAEQAEIAVLERHVKMVNTDGHIKEKNGKKICWNYRKGRCRFGSNCTYAHDSDLYSDSPPDTSAKEIKQDVIPATAIISKVQTGQQIGNNTVIESINSVNEMLTTKKRSRPGLSESIVPSKRVLKSYSNQKQNHIKSKFT